MEKIGWQHFIIDIWKINIQAKYLRGFFQGPGIILPTLGLELFPTELRGFVISSGSVAWALSLSIIPLVAFLLRHVTWRYTMGAAALFGIHSFFTKWYCHNRFVLFETVGPENLTSTKFLYNAVTCILDLFVHVRNASKLLGLWSILSRFCNVYSQLHYIVVAVSVRGRVCIIIQN